MYVSVSLLYESFWKVINYFYFEVMNFMIYILCCELFEIWYGMFGFCFMVFLVGNVNI